MIARPIRAALDSQGRYTESAKVAATLIRARVDSASRGLRSSLSRDHLHGLERSARPLATLAARPLRPTGRWLHVAGRHLGVNLRVGFRETKVMDGAPGT
jgi:hypothetical protein